MQDQDDEQSIKQLIATWLSATEAGNNELVLSFISEDAVFLTPGQPPMRKADFAAAQAGLKQVPLHMTSEIQEVKIFGEWAYCWNKLAVVVSPRNGGKSVTRSGSALSILQKQAGAWVIVRDANMLAVAPK